MPKQPSPSPGTSTLTTIADNASSLGQHLLAMRAGMIPGWRLVLVPAFGDNIVTGSLNSVAGDIGITLSYPVGDVAVSVASTSADDTLLGAGMRTIFADTLDSSYQPGTEIVNMSGQTPANFVTPLHRIQAFRCIAHGGDPSDMNMGQVAVGATSDTWTNGAPANPYSIMPAGHSISQSGIFTIPAGEEGYLVSGAFFGEAAKPALGSVEFRPAGLCWFQGIPIIITDGQSAIPTDAGEAIPAGSDIRVRAVATSQTVTTTVFYGIALRTL